MLLNFYPPSFFTKLKFSFFSNFFSYKSLDAIRNFGISKNKKKKRTLLAEQLLSLTSFSRNERRFSRVFTSFPFTFEKKDIAGRKAYDWSKKKKREKKKENVGSSNFWGELEAVWATRRPAMAEHRAEGSLPPLPARSFHRADRPRDWVGSWVRHNPRWAGRRTSATFDRTPASRGIAAIAGIHLDIASNDCTICPKERSRSRRRCTVLSNEKKS